MQYCGRFRQKAGLRIPRLQQDRKAPHHITTVYKVVQDRCDDQGARSSAAGEGGSSSTLPHLHFEVCARDHLDKLRVDLRWEGGIALEKRPDLCTARAQAVAKKNS